MKNKLPRAITFLVLFILVALSVDVRAQTRVESASPELQTLFSDKRKTIEVETSTLPDNEWVGVYSAVDGPTVSTQLAWSPNSGFAVWWFNCSRPLDLVNFGQAAFANGSLKLSSELAENSPGSYQIGSELIPVKWGSQHFLVPANQMLNFVYAANSTSAPEIETFLLKNGDQEKSRKGLPDVPEPYRKYFRTTPIRASITSLKPSKEHPAQRITLNVGRAEGVIPNMNFYVSGLRGIYLRVHVTEVQEHTSEAHIAMVTYVRQIDRDVRLRVGWKLTSRAPKDERQYWP